MSVEEKDLETLGKILRILEDTPYVERERRFHEDERIKILLNKIPELKDMVLDFLEFKENSIDIQLNTKNPAEFFEFFSHYIKAMTKLYTSFKNNHANEFKTINKTDFLKYVTYGFFRENEKMRIKNMVTNEIRLMNKYFRKYGFVSMVTFVKFPKYYFKMYGDKYEEWDIWEADYEKLSWIINIFAPELGKEVANMVKNLFNKRIDENIATAEKYKNIINAFRSNICTDESFTIARNIIKFFMNYITNDDNTELTSNYIDGIIHLNILYEPYKTRTSYDSLGTEVVKRTIAFLLTISNYLKNRGIDITKFLNELDSALEKGFVAVQKSQKHTQIDRIMTTTMLVPNKLFPTIISYMWRPMYSMNINDVDFPFFVLNNWDSENFTEYTYFVIPKKWFLEAFNTNSGKKNFDYFLEIYNSFKKLLAYKIEFGYTENSKINTDVYTLIKALDSPQIKIQKNEEVLDNLKNKIEKHASDENTHTEIVMLTDDGRLFICRGKCSKRIKEIEQLLPHALVVARFFFIKGKDEHDKEVIELTDECAWIRTEQNEFLKLPPRNIYDDVSYESIIIRMNEISEGLRLDFPENLINATNKFNKMVNYIFDVLNKTSQGNLKIGKNTELTLEKIVHSWEKTVEEIAIKFQNETSKHFLSVIKKCYTELLESAKIKDVDLEL